jgi:hypothetical protein
MLVVVIKRSLTPEISTILSGLTKEIQGERLVITPHRGSLAKLLEQLLLNKIDYELLNRD